jgi:hypothetical protein
VRKAGCSVDVSDSDDRDRVCKAVFDLREHIAKEDGLFPAAVTALDADRWRLPAQAHPGSMMLDHGT